MSNIKDISPFDDFEPELEDDSDDEGLMNTLDKILTADPSPLPPQAPDGGFMPMAVRAPKPIPKATEETFICLRGPCRFYVENKMIADVENADLLDQALKQTNRYCMVIPGYTVNLMDEPGVVDCNQWAPYTISELALRETARDEYRTRTAKPKE